MRNKWPALIAYGLLVIGLPLAAAEKNRDWQTGQVVESKVLTSPQDHAIASADKTYLIRGSVANEDQALAVGATVRFAVEDKNLFLSIAGREYKLYVLGVRASTAKAVPPTPPVTAVTPAAQPVPVPPATAATPAPAAPRAPAPPVAAAPAVSAPVTPAPATPAALASAKPPAPAVVAPAPTSAATLDNDAIVKMIVGGLKEDTVVSVVQARPGKYALSSDALGALRAAGVPQSVIAAMTAKMQAQH
jgi:hypothetical protein